MQRTRVCPAVAEIIRLRDRPLRYSSLAQGSRRVTSTAFDPFQDDELPSSPKARPRGGTLFTSRRNMRSRRRLSGGGVKWVNTRSRTPAATASQAASPGSCRSSRLASSQFLQQRLRVDRGGGRPRTLERLGHPIPPQLRSRPIAAAWTSPAATRSIVLDAKAHVVAPEIPVGDAPASIAIADIPSRCGAARCSGGRWRRHSRRSADTGRECAAKPSPRDLRGWRR
jgi:hypothetical protein